MIYVPAQAGQSKPELSVSYPPEFLQRALISHEDWRPYSPAEDRSFWKSLPEALRKAQIARGESALDRDWPGLPATLFLNFVRTGDRSKYGRAYYARRSRLLDLVLAECVEAKGRFIDEIVNCIWAICEESSWVVPGHLYMQKAGIGLPDTEEPVVDLSAGETINLLAWTFYLLGPQFDTISPLNRRRVLREAHLRVLDVCLKRDDFWWMNLKPGYVTNNWNPWCNSNWLTAVLLLESDEAKRCKAVYKIL